MLGLLVPGGLLVGSNLAQKADQEAEEREQRAQLAQRQCAAFSTRLVGTLQQYVDGFADLRGLGERSLPPLPDVASLRREARGVRRQVTLTQCPVEQFTAAVRKRLSGVTADGALALAVRDVLAANVLDVLEPGGGPRREVVEQGADLVEVLGTLPSGSTVELPAGEFRASRPIVVLQDLTIEGAGPSETTISSDAAEVALLLIAPIRLELRGVSVVHTGPSPATPVVMRAGEAVLTDVEVSGGRAADPGSPAGGRGTTQQPDLRLGGHGVVAAAGRALTLTRVAVTGNEVGGVVVGGAVVADIRSSVIEDNGLCGLCFLGFSEGAVRDSLAEGNGVGLIVGDRSRPRVLRSRMSRNTRSGVVVQRGAAPWIESSSISRNGQFGIAAYERADPTLLRNTVMGHSEVGIILDTSATGGPLVRRNRLVGNRRASLVFAGGTRGRAVGNTCVGSRFGLVLEGEASPVLVDNGCEVLDSR